MVRLKLLPILMNVAILAACGVSLSAQTVHTVPSVEPTPKPVSSVDQPIPFSLNAGQNHAEVGYLSVDQMAEKDRNLVADAESSISERVGFVGLEFNTGKWSYEQLVCPALPNHILLRFTRNDGTGDVSIFSVSIPRNGNGQVRIIPIRLRGYSLFSPAPINALTISAFNHIRSEEHPDALPGWVGIAQCYSALAGGHPYAPPPAEKVDYQKVPLAMPATLTIPARGDVMISFVDAPTAPRPMEWTMIFDRKGKLKKATHKPAPLIQAKVVQVTPGLSGNAARSK
jgi:hypothetical protein